MISTKGFRGKTFLTGLLLLKIAVSVLFLSGGSELFQGRMGVATAVAEDKKEGDGEQGKTPDAEAKAPEEDIKQVLDGLEEKRLLVQKQTEVLRQEEVKLEALKVEIQEKIDKLTELQKKVQASIDHLEQTKSDKALKKEQDRLAAHEAKMQQLVALYSKMKPKNAAPIINEMDVETAKEIFMRMKGAQAGKILALVNSQHAAKISELMAKETRGRKK